MHLPQSTRVVYREGRSDLKQFRMGQREFDFNEDGLAHYGLLPDLLQDLKNLGDEDIEIMFRSAEGYLQMWEKLNGCAGLFTSSDAEAAQPVSASPSTDRGSSSQRSEHDPSPFSARNASGQREIGKWSA